MTSRSLSLLVAAPAVAVTLFLTGCASGAAAPTPTATEKWTPSASASATPTASASPTKSSTSSTPSAEEIGQGIIKILKEGNVDLSLTDEQATCMGQAMLDEPGISERTLQNTAEGRDIQKDEAEKKLVSTTITEAAKACRS